VLNNESDTPVKVAKCKTRKILLPHSHNLTEVFPQKSDLKTFSWI